MLMRKNKHKIKWSKF